VAVFGLGCQFDRQATTAICGDGVVAEEEICDDGNRENGDSCPSTCLPAICGDGVVERGIEGCDDGNDDDTDECLPTCVSSTCGDGDLQADVEGCDDGNQENDDSCTNTCVPARCGDGFVEQGVEECDDENSLDSDGCLNDCQAATCGDGIVYEGVEQCDDGNTANNDGCDANCTFPCGRELPELAAAVRQTSGQGGACFARSDLVLTWGLARLTCLRYGGDLVSISSQEDNDAVRNVLQGRTGWIGLQDLENENQFEWSDNSALTYRNWALGEPNNQSGEDCVEMYGQQPNGSWNDNDCERLRSFVCEFSQGTND
jgi:cysteine-rich repeat protein